MRISFGQPTVQSLVRVHGCAGLALYWWHRQITFASSRLRVKADYNYEPNPNPSLSFLAEYTQQKFQNLNGKEWSTKLNPANPNNE